MSNRCVQNTTTISDNSFFLFVHSLDLFCKTTDLKPNMEGNTTPAPKPNAFVIADDEAYAMTNIQTFTAIEFLLTKLEPVNLEALGPEDAVCTICHQEFRISSDVKHSHAPVKTPCRHIFGQKCLMKWLGPLSSWGSQSEHHATAADPSPATTHGNTSCPLCRQALVPNFPIEPLESLASRLAFWDKAYAGAGVARSEREDRSRTILWGYVDCCRAMDELGHDILGARFLAQTMFMRWLHALRSRIRTPQQEYLRQKLIWFAWGSKPLGTGHGELEEE